MLFDFVTLKNKINNNRKFYVYIFFFNIFKSEKFFVLNLINVNRKLDNNYI